MNNPVILFQKIGRKIFYQFLSHTSGYRKKPANQPEIYLAKKGEVFQQYDLLHVKSECLRYSIGGNFSGQYDPRIFAGKYRRNLWTGGES